MSNPEEALRALAVMHNYAPEDYKVTYEVHTLNYSNFLCLHHLSSFSLHKFCSPVQECCWPLCVLQLRQEASRCLRRGQKLLRSEDLVAGPYYWTRFLCSVQDMCLDNLLVKVDSLLVMCYFVAIINHGHFHSLVYIRWFLSGSSRPPSSSDFPSFSSKFEG